MVHDIGTGRVDLGVAEIEWTIRASVMYSSWDVGAVLPTVPDAVQIKFYIIDTLRNAGSVCHLAAHG